MVKMVKLNPFKKKVKKIDSSKGTAVWVDEFGTLSLRVFTIIGKKEKKVKIDFGNSEVYIINARNIRAKRVIIYKTEEGKIKVQNPNKWKDINLKKYNIKELRFNLQNFGIQEGKASIHRWTLPKDVISKLAPLFKLLVICIVIGVIGWASLKFGTYVLDVVMKSRLLDCGAVLPRQQVPIDAPVGANVTAALSLLFFKKIKKYK